MSNNDMHITWQDIHFDGIALAKMVKDKGWLDNCEGLIAVTRGGLIPTGVFCNATGIKNVESICVSSYSFKNNRDLEVIKSIDLENGGAGWIIIDDLVDTGNTYAFLKTLLPKAKRVCLYAKPEGEKNTDLFVKSIEQGVWVHFPWEVDSDGVPFEKE